MGLERVELAMEFEEHFGIQIPDDKIGTARTVADLAAAIISHLPTSSQPCPTVRAFFDLRTLLITRAGIARARIRPGTKLAELFPPHRHGLWNELRRHKHRLPELYQPAPPSFQEVWAFIALAFGVVSAFNLVIALLLRSQIIPYLMLVIFSTIAIVAFKRNIIAPARFPDGFQTIGDVTRLLTPAGPTASEIIDEQLRRNRLILEEVRVMVARQAGRPVETITADTDLQHDLDM